MTRFVQIRRMAIRATLVALVWVVPVLGETKTESKVESAATGKKLSERYHEVSERIVKETMSANDSWRKLEVLCDEIGHRLSGSAALEKAVKWAADEMRRDGHENVRLEPVMVPKWVRGQESITLLEPRKDNLFMIGLGGSVGTPPEGITAQVVSVKDEKELESLGDQVKGKIVLFDNPMPPYDPVLGSQYGTFVRFRSRGPQMAAKQGAVACLVRSVTAKSLRSPHTGATNYGDAEVKIPAAAISTEDSAMIARLNARKVPVVVNLKMEARTEEPAPSANVIGEIRGSEKPDEIVIISGHLDSWDAGCGAHDDGGGCVQAMEALNVLRKLKLQPKRTIRAILWTNEENGLAGGKAYAKEHEAELPKHVAAIESDGGSFKPTGYSVDCSDEDKRTLAVDQMNDILSLFEKSIGPMSAKKGGAGADIGPMKPAGFVMMGHEVEGTIYFDYHHTHADTLDKVNPTELSQNVAVMATVAYILADMPERLGESTSK